MDIFELSRDLVYYGLEQFGKYYSEYRATVLNADDPEGLQRIKVVIPEITGTNQAYQQWVFPKSRYYGDNYGIHILPRKGDTVLITFERGDKDAPLYSFAPTQKNKVVDSNLLGNKIWLKTKSGCLILINEDTGDMSFTNKHGVKLELKGDTLFTGKIHSTLEPFVKGDTLASLLQSLLEKEVSLYTETSVQLAAQGAALNALAPGLGVPLNTLASSFSSKALELSTIITEINSIKSTICFTE